MLNSRKYEGHFPFSQNLQKFRFGSKWKTFRRLVHGKIPGKGGKSKKVGPFPGWNVLNGISAFIYTFLVLYTRYNCHQLGSHLGVPKKNQGMKSCVSCFLNGPQSLYFNEQQKDEEYNWPTTYRARAALVSIITI